MKWNQDEYTRHKQSFIRRRLNLAPVRAQLTLVFAATWGAA